MALILSLTSSHAIDEGNYPAAKTRGRCSCYVSLLGIVATLVAIVIGVFMIMGAVSKATSALDDWNSLLSASTSAPSG